MRKIYPIAFLVAFFFVGVHQVQAASTLTISSATIGADGRTITLNISGVTGSLSPASGITGFTFKLATSSPVQQTQLEQASSTSSGSVVTVTLKAFVLQGETVTVNLGDSSTSNLTDTGANTPVGQTDVSVTNNSTRQGVAVSASSSSAFFWFGPIADGSSSGHNFRSISRGKIFFTVNGTDADVQLYNGDYTVIVDGVSYTISATGPGWTWVSLFSGLTNTSHTVEISVSSGFFDVDNTLRISASSGAGVAAPTGFTTPLIIESAPFSTYAKVDGGIPVIPGGFPDTATATDVIGSIGGLRFKAAVTDIWLWMWQGLTDTIRLYKDGVDTGATPVVTGVGAWDLTHIASGLDNQPHVYEILNKKNAPLVAYQIMLTGTGLISEVQPTRPVVSIYGDSITAGAGLGGDFLGTDGWLIARPFGFTPNIQGFGGARVSTYLRDNTTQVTSLGSTTKVVILAGGTNDMSSAVPIGDVNTPNTFAGDMKTMISNVGAGLFSGSTILVRGILPSATVTESQRATYVAAQQAAVNAYMATSPTVPAYFINTDGWVSSTTPDLPDGLHPETAGYIKIANREIPLVLGLINGSSYTVTGPSSASSLATSTNFTVTAASSSTFTGDQTITLSDGGRGGTFTPSVGSSSVSPITITPTASTTSFTFTYTPASAGTSTLTFTNGQSWTDPSPLTYTAVIPHSAANISSVATSTPTTSSIILTWTTDQLTDSAVAYGTTTSYTATTTDATLTLSHTITLTSLTPATTYHYQITSANSFSDATSTVDATFTTAAVPVVESSRSGRGSSHRQVITPPTTQTQLTPALRTALIASLRQRLVEVMRELVKMLLEGAH